MLFHFQFGIVIHNPSSYYSLIDDFGRRIGGELYDPVNGVIRKEEVGVKVSTIISLELVLTNF